MILWNQKPVLHGVPKLGMCKGIQDLAILCLWGRRFPSRLEDPLPPERVKLVRTLSKLYRLTNNYVISFKHSFTRHVPTLNSNTLFETFC